MSFSFGNVGTSKPKSSSKKSSTPERQVDGIKDLAACDTALAAIKSIRETIEGEIKEQNAAHFVAEGCAIHRRPDNFRGIEDGSQASCELRKRSDRSSLSDEEVKLCAQFGIETRTVTDTINTFIINPDHLQDKAVMGVLEKLIAGAVAAGKLPGDIMQKQDGVTRTVVAEDALDALFVSATPEVAARCLPLVGTQALGKAKFDGSLEDAIKHLGTLSPKFAKAEAKADKGKKAA